MKRLRGHLYLMAVVSSALLTACMKTSMVETWGPSSVRQAVVNAPFTAPILQASVPGERAYIPNRHNYISVVDVESGRVLGSIPVNGTAQGIAASPTSRFFYLPLGRLYVYNALTGVLSATINVASDWAVALNASASRLYDDDYFGESLNVIDTATNTVIANVPLPLACGPFGVAVNPTKPFAYVACGFSSQLAVVDTDANTLAATIYLGGSATPTGVAVTSDGQAVYVASGQPSGAGDVDVIDTTNNTLADKISLGLNGYGTCIAITPDGKYAYAGRDDQQVSVIKIKSNTITKNIAVGNYPNGISVDPSGKYVLVSNNDDGTISVISTATNTVKSTIAVGGNPIALGSFIR